MNTDPSDARDRDKCANCCTLFGERDFRNDLENYHRTQNRTKVMTLTLKINGEDETVQVTDALTEVYRLDWFQKIELNQAEAEQNELNLCLDCFVVFSQLYKLFSEFQLLRKAESALAERLKTINNAIDLFAVNSVGTVSNLQCASVSDWDAIACGDELRTESWKLPEINGVDVNGVKDEQLHGMESESSNPVVYSTVSLLAHNSNTAGYPVSYSAQNSFLSSVEELVNVSQTSEHSEVVPFRVSESGEIAPDVTPNDCVSEDIVNLNCVDHAAEDCRVEDVDPNLLMYGCADCSMNFKTAAELGMHRYGVHRSSEVYKCHVCTKVFGRGSNLKRHIKLHSSGRAYKCKICSASFEEFSRVQKHIKCVHRTTPHCKWERVSMSSDARGECYKSKNSARFPAPNHNFETNIRTSAVNEEAAFYPTKFSEISPRVRGAKGVLEQVLGLDCDKHTAVFSRCEEAYSGSPTYGCADCSMTFASGLELGTHRIDVHRSSEVYKCHICMKVIGRNDNFRRHMRRHSSSRPYKCKICSVTFKDSVDITRHIRRVHKTNVEGNLEVTGRDEEEISGLSSECRAKKVHPCRLCNQEFLTDVNLAHHLTSVHVVDFSFRCIVCSSLDDTLEEWRAHAATHSKHKCVVCGKIFSARKSLVRHLRRHTQQRLHSRIHSDVIRDYVAGLDAEQPSFTLPSSLSVPLVDQGGQEDSFPGSPPREPIPLVYKCTDCEDDFHSAVTLGAHRSSAHQAADPFKCYLCWQCFLCPKELRLHLTEHFAGGIGSDVSTIGPGGNLQVILSEEVQTKEEFDEPDVIILD